MTDSLAAPAAPAGKSRTLIKRSALGLAALFVAVGAVGGTTALLGGEFTIEGNTGETGQYALNSGPSTYPMAAALYPGSYDSQTVEIVNDGVFGAAYGLEVDLLPGATVDESIFDDIDVTIVGDINWTGSWEEFQTNTLIWTDTLPPGANTFNTITLSVPEGVTNPGFGQTGEFEYDLRVVHSQDNGVGTPDVKVGMTVPEMGTGTGIKPRS